MKDLSHAGRCNEAYVAAIPQEPGRAPMPRKLARIRERAAPARRCRGGVGLVVVVTKGCIVNLLTW